MEKIKKLCLACLLLAGASFSLAAQSASVYLPPVTGTGINQRDNAFFFSLISRELLEQGLTIGTNNSSEFSIVGILSSRRTNTVPSIIEYRFELNLHSNRTNQNVLTLEYIYENLNNADSIVKSMLSHIIPIIQPQSAEQTVRPFTPENEGDWRDRWLFFGLSAYWYPRLYVDVEGNYGSHWGNFGLGLSTEFQFLNFLSLETGATLTTDWVVILEYTGDKNYQDLMLEVPVLLKGVFKPGSNFLLEPYGGINLNFSFFGITNPPLLSWVAGYQHSVKAGPGAFLFDFRFSMDLEESSLNDITYQRYSFSIGAGYKYGVFQK